jgi:hypothetical protein
MGSPPQRDERPFTEPRVVAAIADLSDVDPILVSPPKVLHLVSSREIGGFLPPQRGLFPAPLVHVPPICSQTSAGPIRIWSPS